MDAGTDTLLTRLEDRYGRERASPRHGLDGTRTLLRALGNPEASLRFVHVGGTNGKGSVCALVERVLREAGLRTGLFTSPHLLEFRERIRADGRLLPEGRLAALLDRIDELPESEGRTFFEVLTALGFLAFAESAVDWVVAEVGLGGRLDCTNVIRPALTVLTSVGLDHTEVLGDTHEAVALEKAGIVKDGVDVVSAVAHPEASRVIERVSLERNAPLVKAHDLGFEVVHSGPDGLRVGADTEAWGRIEAVVALRGRHQSDNVRTAVAALDVLAARGADIPPGAVVRGLETVRWPGRLEPCPTEPRLWWDGAHNPDGAKALATAWFQDISPHPPDTLVLAVASDKDARGIVDALARLRPARVLCTEAASERVVPAGELCRIAEGAGLATQQVPRVPDAIREALDSSPSGVVLLAGSLVAVGEAMRAAGAEPYATEPGA